MQVKRGLWLWSLLLVALLASCERNPLSEELPGAAGPEGMILGTTPRGPQAGPLSAEGPRILGPGTRAPVPLAGGAVQLAPPGTLEPQRLAPQGGLASAGTTPGILWQNTDSGARVLWQMNGPQWEGGYASLPTVETVWEIVGSGDFNSDGHPDLLWQHRPSGQGVIWFMQAAGYTGQYAVLPAVGPLWQVAGVGDFNGDGRPDILWQQVQSGERAIWFMNGASYSGQYALLPTVDPAWRIAGVGDFNGDGGVDLVWEHTGGWRVIWFLNGALYQGQHAYLPHVDPAWRIAGVGDFNGDGRRDLLWEHTSGWRVIWFLNGAVWEGGHAYLPHVDPVWRIAGALEPPTRFNLSIESVHLNQGSQTAGGTIGGVAGRPGLLRVVVRASEPNSFAPPVRLRLFQGPNLLREVLLPAPQNGVPTNPDLSLLNHSWNLQLTAAEVVAGVQVEAVVDPEGTIPESDRSDNRFPRGEGRALLDVLGLHPLRIVFIPIHATVQNTTGNINAGNTDLFLQATRQWIPSSTILPTVRDPYTTSLDLRSPGTWTTLLAEIQAVRTAEAAVDQYYHGIIGDFPGIPVFGIGYQPFNPAVPYRTALSFDRHPRATETVAHELGHNLGRRHAPCGAAAGPDPQFPHPNARLGSAGYDILSGSLHAPDSHRDFMGYCQPQWTSDYTYNGILQWRRTDPLAVAAAPVARPAGGQPTAGVLLWGRIGTGGVTLNPAFVLTTVPVLPEASGPNQLRGLAADGSELFRFSFAGVPVADAEDAEERHFTYFLPLPPAELERLARIELTSPHGAAARHSALAQQQQQQVQPEVRLETLARERIRLRWDAERYPMALVRDRLTGQVLSFARRGELELVAGARTPEQIEVILSDGVRSRHARRR